MRPVRVRCLTDRTGPGEFWRAGDVIEISEFVARWLISSGVAERIDARGDETASMGIGETHDYEPRERRPC